MADETKPEELAKGCLVLLVIAGLAWLFFLRGPGSAELAKRPAITASAESIWADFAANPVGASDKFKDKNIIVDGSVANITDSGGGGSLELASPNRDYPVTLEFDSAGRSAVGKLATGQRIRSRCTSLSNLGALVTLSGCSTPTVGPDPAG